MDFAEGTLHCATHIMSNVAPDQFARLTCCMLATGGTELVAVPMGK